MIACAMPTLAAGTRSWESSSAAAFGAGPKAIAGIVERAHGHVPQIASVRVRAGVRVDEDARFAAGQPAALVVGINQERVGIALVGAEGVGVKGPSRCAQRIARGRGYAVGTAGNEAGFAASRRHG